MIVPMERAIIAGPQSLLEDCLEVLHNAKVIHISASHGASEIPGFLVGIRGSARLSMAQSLLLDVKSALNILSGTVPGRSDLLSFEHAVGMDWLAPGRAEYISGICKGISSTRSRQAELSSELESLEGRIKLFEGLRPAMMLTDSLISVELAAIALHPSSGISAKQLEDALSVSTGGACEVWRSGEEPFLAAYPLRMREKVENAVFGPLNGKVTVSRNTQEGEEPPLTSIFERHKKVSRGLAECGEGLAEHSKRFHALLHTAERGLEYAIKELRIRDHIAESGLAFCITGWIPADRTLETENILADRFSGKVVIAASPPRLDDYPEVPVLLKNPVSAGPYERILRYFPPPVYGSPDPTRLVRYFFPLFFGLILGDIGYAILILSIAKFIRVRRQGVRLWDDISSTMYSCGLWGLSFGAVFGEFFNLPFAFYPHFDRVNGAPSLLEAVLALGGLHIVLGNVLGGADLFSRGNYRGGTGKILSSVLIFLAAYIGYKFATVRFWSDGAATLFVTVLFARIAIEGPWTVFETIRLFSAVFSYARLMALGIASAMLAAAAFKIYQFPGLAGVLGAICLHLLNFGIGILSPAVQSLRLHLVEFFGQFAREGTSRFAPYGAA